MDTYQIIEYPKDKYVLRKLKHNCPNQSFVIIKTGTLWDCERAIKVIKDQKESEHYNIFGKLVKEIRI